MKNEVARVRMSEELLEQIDRLADITERDRSKIIRLAVKKYLKESGIMLVKATDVKETVTELIEEKGWEKLRIWEQSLEGVTPEQQKYIVNFKSGKYDHIMDGWEKYAQEAKDFGREDEPEVVIKDMGNIIRIGDKESHTDISDYYNPRGKENK